MFSIHLFLVIIFYSRKHVWESLDTDFKAPKNHKTKPIYQISANQNVYL